MNAYETAPNALFIEEFIEASASAFSETPTTTSPCTEERANLLKICGLTAGAGTASSKIKHHELRNIATK